MPVGHMNWLGFARRPGASAVLQMPRAISEHRKQMAIQAGSVGLNPANPFSKLITAWMKWSPEGALVLLEGVLVGPALLIAPCVYPSTAQTWDNKSPQKHNGDIPFRGLCPLLAGE